MSADQLGPSHVDLVPGGSVSLDNHGLRPSLSTKGPDAAVRDPLHGFAAEPSGSTIAAEDVAELDRRFQEAIRGSVKALRIHSSQFSDEADVVVVNPSVRPQG